MQDLAVVHYVDVEFMPGLTVVTGETGAGKSILIDALGLTLGARAESTMVRTGAASATVSAVFEIGSNAAARELLEAHELASGDECVLRRVVSKDGRSRAFCNATPVPAQMLREISEHLADIHAQHAGQRLLHREHQRLLLDEFGCPTVQLVAVRVAYDEWKRASNELEQLEAQRLQRDRHELLQYQCDELDAAAISEEQLQALETEHDRLAHAVDNLDQCGAIRALLNAEDGAAVGALQSALSRAQEFNASNPAASALAESLDQSVVAAEEALRELARLESSIKVDPARFAQTDARLAELHELARKHRVQLRQLPELAADLRRELDELEGTERRRETLLAEIKRAHAAYRARAGSLSQAREQSADRLRDEVSRRMRELGMPQANFRIQLSRAEDDVPRPYGQDSIEFEVSTNPDLAPRPLAKVASGGEITRIGLAIQASSVAQSGVPVVVYDEADAGVGGATATIVGRNLRRVAQACQVICITHSAQVASAGDHHLVVTKALAAGRTKTTIRALDAAEREMELARMLGAAEATQSSLAHARDLISAASE